jgi:hypothetical protein
MSQKHQVECPAEIIAACHRARLGISRSVRAATLRKRFPLVALVAISAAFIAAAPLIADTALVVKSPMAPPEWALLERQLLKSNSDAVELFAKKYVDDRGYLLHTIRWGTLDGPDDAIETYFNWTLLHALGGSDPVLQLYKKAQEGHWKQYGELDPLTELAKSSAYYKEFITMSDWFHTGEGMRVHAMDSRIRKTKYIARVNGSPVST